MPPNVKLPPPAPTPPSSVNPSYLHCLSSVTPSSPANTIPLTTSAWVLHVHVYNVYLWHVYTVRIYLTASSLLSNSQGWAHKVGIKLIDWCCLQATWYHKTFRWPKMVPIITYSRYVAPYFYSTVTTICDLLALLVPQKGAEILKLWHATNPCTKYCSQGQADKMSITTYEQFRTFY